MGAVGWSRLLQAEKEIASLNKQLMHSGLEASQQYQEMSKLKSKYTQFFQVQLTQTIQGETYTLESADDANAASLRLIQSNSSSGEAEKNSVVSFNHCCNKPTDFWYNVARQELFLLIEDWATPHDKRYSIRKISLQTPGDTNKRTDFTVASVQEFELKPPQTGQLKYVHFYDYDERSNSLLLIDQYGDGCGGTGALWNWRYDRPLTRLADWTQGCTAQKTTVQRFAGRYQDKLIMADFTPSSDSEQAVLQIAGKLRSVYLLNPFTGDKQSILFTIPDFDTSAFSDLLSSYEHEQLVLNGTIKPTEIVISIATDALSQKQQFAYDLASQETRQLTQL